MDKETSGKLCGYSHSCNATYAIACYNKQVKNHTHYATANTSQHKIFLFLINNQYLTRNNVKGNTDYLK